MCPIVTVRQALRCNEVSAIRWLAAGDDPGGFPSPYNALDEPNGLLAAGGDLKPERLLLAYRSGIFPWYERGQPILWWCPNPRAILLPNEFRPSRSLRRRIEQRTFRITADMAFDQVLHRCARPRHYCSSTWITEEMAAAYCELHRLGWAHSFETWQDDRLVGGLYGVAIGRVFFGESMFSEVSDASKVAFASAVAYLRARSFELIDCQVSSAHMQSLGAINWPRSEFLEALGSLCSGPQRLHPWNEDHAACQA
jgi:leucyl/phenylalanyl-tRNA---protein transferase